MHQQKQLREKTNISSGVTLLPKGLSGNAPSAHMLPNLYSLGQQYCMFCGYLTRLSCKLHNIFSLNIPFNTFFQSLDEDLFQKKIDLGPHI